MADLILLIDDDESLRRVTEYNLTSAGFQVISAAVPGWILVLPSRIVAGLHLIPS